MQVLARSPSPVTATATSTCLLDNKPHHLPKSKPTQPPPPLISTKSIDTHLINRRLCLLLGILLQTLCSIGGLALCVLSGRLGLLPRILGCGLSVHGGGLRLVPRGAGLARNFGGGLLCIVRNLGGGLLRAVRILLCLWMEIDFSLVQPVQPMMHTYSGAFCLGGDHVLDSLACTGSRAT